MAVERHTTLAPRASSRKRLLAPAGCPAHTSPTSRTPQLHTTAGIKVDPGYPAYDAGLKAGAFMRGMDGEPYLGWVRRWLGCRCAGPCVDLAYWPRGVVLCCDVM